MSFFSNLYQSYGTLYTPIFCFRSICLEIDINSQNFMYAFILTRSRWELLPVFFVRFFCLFVTMSWPLIEFLLNVLRFSCLMSFELGLLNNANISRYHDTTNHFCPKV